MQRADRRLLIATVSMAAALALGPAARAQSYPPPPPPSTAAPTPLAPPAPPGPGMTPGTTTTVTTTVVSPPPPPVAAPEGAVGAITSPEVISECLCSQRRTEAFHRRVEEAQAHYRDANERVEGMKRQMETSRASVDENNPESVDAYRRLVTSEEEASAHLFNEVLPRTQAVVRRYNEMIARYNAQCTGRVFDGAVLQQVTTTLSCPGPE